MKNNINCKKTGIFIAFEGIDGSGKSTQITKLTDLLSTKNIKHYSTCEPTDSPIGSLIRQIMTGRIVTDNKAIAALFVADRIDHLLNKTNGICEYIQNGVSVITDRYYFSSYAYHGVDMDMNWVIDSNSVSAEILKPDLTVFLDIPVEKAIQRIENNRFNIELFEKEERLMAVKKKYYEAFDKLKDREKIVVIDADADADVVFERIWSNLSHLFE